MDSCTLRITASATLTHPAERAVLTFALQSAGDKQDKVTADVLATTKHLLSEIDKIRVVDAEGKITPESPITYVNTTAISTWSQMEVTYQDPTKPNTLQQRHKIYHSQSNLEVRFRDFAMLSHITTVFAAVPYCEMQRVNWKLLDETEDHLKEQARKDALREAIKRAKDYCEVANLRNCRPTNIHDTGHTNTGGHVMQTAYRHTDHLDLKAEHKKISAQVEVEFTAQY